ncbi:MAG: hypothetical protein ACRC6K_07780 [Fusobacteriaceae bacterium]
MNKKKFFLIIFPIILGFSIYLLFRSKSLFYFNFFEFLNMDKFIIPLREFTLVFRNLIPNWVIYALPDGLWIFSFGITLLYSSFYFLQNFIIYTFIFLFMIGFEFFQLHFGGHGKTIGTFDINDIYAFSVGYILAFIFSIFSKKNNHTNSLDVVFIILIYVILAILPTLVK